GFDDDLRALVRRGAGPDAKTFCSSLESVVEVGPRRVRNSGEHAFVRRVQHRLSVATAPFATDIELQVRIVRHRSLRPSSAIAIVLTLCMFEYTEFRGPSIGWDDQSRRERMRAASSASRCGIADRSAFASIAR